MQAPPVPTDMLIRGWRARATYFNLLRDPIGAMRDLHQRHGRFILLAKHNRARRREVLTALVVGPDYNRKILTDPNVFRSRGFGVQGPPGSAQQRIRVGLISMNADQYWEHRRLVLPLLVKASVDKYAEDMVDLTDRLLNTWGTGQQRDMWQQMHQLSLWIVSKVLFGADDAQQALRLGTLIHRWIDLCFRPQVILFPVDWPGTAYHRLLALAEAIERSIHEMIEQRKSTDRKPGDLLSALIEAHHQESGSADYEGLIGPTNILFTAAHGTNASALAWRLFLLFQHPQCMAALLEELRGKLHGDPPRPDQLNQLPLLDHVIKESMRLLPPISWGSRILDSPAHLGGHGLPKGSRVYTSHYLTHRLPEFFPNPQRFEPSRWECNEPPPFSYLPFGAGPRLCLGYTFSMTLIKTVLAMVLQRFRLSLVPGARIDRKVALALVPKYGVPMRIHDQDGVFCQAPPRGNIHEMVDLPRVRTRK